MLALKLLLRNWRSGELRLLSISLMLAVAVLSGIAIFTERLDTSLAAQSAQLLGADSVITGPHMPPSTWEDEAGRAGLRQSKAAVFETMLYAGDAKGMALASVKAVSASYPLRGHLEISQTAFATQATDIQIVTGIPASGEAWIDSRLLPLLKLRLGDKIAVGEIELKVTQVLLREPDLFSFSPRLLMNMNDLPATQVLQPGSMVDYKWLLAADNPGKLTEFIKKIKPQLSQHQRLTDSAMMQERLGNVAKTGKQFLMLTTIIAVLLSGVAIAIAARQFSDRHTNQVALMKSLGVSAGRIRGLYFMQLFLLGIGASLIGLVFGELIQRLVATSLQQIYKIALGNPSVLPYVLSFFSGILCLTFFALPALWFLPGVPPMKILRKELAVNFPQVWIQVLLALVAVLLLLMLFSQDILLTALVGAGLLAVLILSVALSLLLLSVSKYLAANMKGAWRLAWGLALSGLQRRKWQSVLQIIVFSIAIMSLLTVGILRSSLIDDWSAKIPKDAPNHFLMNIPADQVDTVQAMLDDQKVAHETFYPLLRARVTHIKGIEPDEALRKKSRTLDAENMVTWAEKLLPGNSIVAGQWWGKWQRSAAQLPGVSIGAETAQNIGVKVGDKMRFSIGGILHEAEVASLRKFEESSTGASFAYIFEPGSLAQMSPTYSAGFYLPPERKNLVHALLRAHPTIALYEMDRLLAQMQEIIRQISDSILLVLFLVLVAAGLVLVSAVQSSIASRRQETGLLRALGSSRQLVLGSVWLEFSVLGMLAGTVAIIGAELILFGLQSLVLKTPLHAHYAYWLATPVLSALVLGVLGGFSCRSVVNTPPGLVLRGVN